MRPLLRGSGAPSFCWVCFRQLQRAPGRGKGLFYFAAVRDKDGRGHRVHGGECLSQAIADGNKEIGFEVRERVEE